MSEHPAIIFYSSIALVYFGAMGAIWLKDYVEERRYRRDKDRLAESFDRARRDIDPY
jgi:hypothetical protein